MKIDALDERKTKTRITIEEFAGGDEIGKIPPAEPVPRQTNSKTAGEHWQSGR